VATYMAGGVTRPRSKYTRIVSLQYSRVSGCNHSTVKPQSPDASGAQEQLLSGDGGDSSLFVGIAVEGAARRSRLIRSPGWASDCACWLPLTLRNGGGLPKYSDPAGGGAYDW
jgi:hypothetical protein